MTARPGTLWRLNVVFMLAYGAAVAVAWSELPAHIPMHFGLDGRVDRWTEHAVWIWFGLPLIAAGLAVLLRVLGRFAVRYPEIWNVPRKDEFLSLSERARRPIVESLDAFLAATSLGAGLLFAAIQAGVYLAATGRSEGLPGPVFGVMVAVILGILVGAVALGRRLDDRIRDAATDSRHGNRPTGRA